MGGESILQKDKMTKPVGSPECFGSSLWSPTDKECVGGPDPGYTHPVTGVHARERCRWYQSCATVSSQNRLIHPQNLVRPTVTAQPPQPTLAGVQAPPRPVAPNPALATRPPLHMPQASYPQYQPVQYQQQPQQPYVGYAPPHIAQWGSVQVPLPFQQPGAQMPAYLTMPEPIRPGESAISVLARTLLRSMMKAFGHALASFVDHTPIRPHRPPE